LLIALILVAFGFVWTQRGDPSQANAATATCSDAQPDELDIHYAAPPAGVIPVITVEQAIESAKKYADFADFKRPVDINAQYVLFSDNVRGGATVAGDDDTVTLDFQNVPAWVITFCGLSIPAHGTERIAKAGHVLPNHTEWNVVVNAQTGAYMEEYTFR
jgi:hypothetical protein